MIDEPTREEIADALAKRIVNDSRTATSATVGMALLEAVGSVLKDDPKLTTMELALGMGSFFVWIYDQNPEMWPIFKAIVNQSMEETPRISATVESEVGLNFNRIFVQGVKDEEEAQKVEAWIADIQASPHRRKYLDEITHLTSLIKIFRESQSS